jgi:hypothetical protein
VTDRELLVLCQAAFQAIPVAARARKVLKSLDRKPIAYAGNGSHILASEMAQMIDEHLQGKL